MYLRPAYDETGTIAHTGKDKEELYERAHPNSRPATPSSIVSSSKKRKRFRPSAASSSQLVPISSPKEEGAKPPQLTHHFGVNACVAAPSLGRSLSR